MDKRLLQASDGEPAWAWSKLVAAGCRGRTGDVPQRENRGFPNSIKASETGEEPVLPLRLLPKTSKNDVLLEGGSDGNEAGLGDNSSVRTLMWRERVKVFWKLLEIKLSGLM